MNARVLLVLLVLAGCGGGKKDAKPKTAPATSASASSSGSKAKVPANLGALILDWRPEHRADLEASMKTGLTILHFDADGIGPVKGCKGPGVYAFAASDRTETALQLTTAEEIKVTLPTYGTSIASKMERELADGGSIDIGIVSVGKTTTTWNRLTHKELKGDCAGATHFVRSAAIGAYAVRTGRKGHARSADDILSRAEGTHDVMLQKAGSMTGCKRASFVDSEPREGCNSVLGIELQKIE